MTDTTPITDLGLSATLPAIGWDYERLRGFALSIKERYTGLVVTEDEIAKTKHEMAELNRLKKQVDDARKETVRSVSAPIKDFEGQVKDVTAIFDEVYRFLGDQVKAFEDAAREQKRQEVQFLIEATTSDAGYPGLSVPIQDAWLNKSKPLKAVKAEVEAIILAHVKAEREAAQLEQAKKDRAVAIEEASSARAAEYGFSIPASQFLRLNDLEIPLTDVHGQIIRAYEFQAETMRKANVAPVAPVQSVPQSTPLEVPTAGPAMAPAMRKSLTISLEFDPAREGEINQALRHLETLCMAFRRTVVPYAAPALQPMPRAPRPY